MVISTIVDTNVHNFTYLHRDAVIKIPELPNEELCVSKQSPCQETQRFASAYCA